MLSQMVDAAAQKVKSPTSSLSCMTDTSYHHLPRLSLAPSLHISDACTCTLLSAEVRELERVEGPVLERHRTVPSAAYKHTENPRNPLETQRTTPPR